MRTRRFRRSVLALLTLALVSVGSAADELYVYPAKGQSAEKQARDQQDCHEWAVKQTGVDPEKVAAQAAQPSDTGRGPLAGMAEGAGIGALAGAGEGAAGAGAARGVGIGRVVSMVRARRAREEQHDAYMQAHQEEEAQLANYDRAYSACLTGRGYTVQ
jgi:hypothetical protein